MSGLAPTLTTQLDAGDIPTRAWVAIARQAELVLDLEARARAASGDTAIKAATAAWVDAERTLGALLGTVGVTVPPGYEDAWLVLRLLDGRLLGLCVHAYTCRRTGGRHL